MAAAVTDKDPQRRPSRLGWPMRTQATTTSAGTHDHGMPRWLICCLIVMMIVELMIIVIIWLLVQRQQTLSHYRNQETARTRQEMRDGFCDLLDQFPQSALLDAPRQKYHCGPGIPVSQLPPAIRQQWPQGGQVATPSPTTAPTESPAAPSQAPSPSTPAPAAPSSAVAASPGRPSATVPPRPPGAPPSVAPAPDPLLCQLLPVCPEVP
jgi:hypothetical protein